MIDIEVWKSDHNRKECHYFIRGGNVGYQHNTYLFGYNPELIDDATMEKIMDLIAQHTGIARG